MRFKTNFNTFQPHSTYKPKFLINAKKAHSKREGPGKIITWILGLY